MKVGFMASHADGGRSGIAQYEINLMRHICALGGEDEIHLFVNRKHADSFHDIFDTVRCHPVSGILSHPIASVAWHQTVLPCAARRAKLDLLHLSSHQRLIFFKGCPTVGTIHDLGGFVIEGKYSPSRMFYLKKVIPILARRLDAIITDSAFSKSEIERIIGMDGDRIHVIHLGYDADRFAEVDLELARDVARRKCHLPEHYFLYVARLEHPAKNHVGLIDAFARLRHQIACPHKLVFIGQEWSGAEKIHQRVRDNGLQDEVIFPGYVSNEDLPLILAAAEAFVFPSLFEGFGIPPIEAMASGVPVICSDAACLPETVGDAALLVNAREPEQLCDAMRRIVEDADLRADLKAKGLKRCRRFTWRQTAQKTLKVYDTITGNGTVA